MGDLVLARDQHDAGDDVDPRMVEEVFTRTAYHLRHLYYTDGGGNIEHLQTTDEHPFHIEGLGWVPAGELTAGMVLSDLDGAGGETLTLLRSWRDEHPDGITVFNMRVGSDHTYFVEDGVGEADWAWVHNADYGHSGRQQRLRQLVNDPNVSSANRGWIKQEINAINRGSRSSIRNPPNTILAHPRGREAAKGFNHVEAPSTLQDVPLHRTQHRYDDFGRRNPLRE